MLFTKYFFLFPFAFFYNTIYPEVLKGFWSKDFGCLWRNRWPSQDAGAKWVVKKGVPAGKSGIKEADYWLCGVRLSIA